MNSRYADILVAALVCVLSTVISAKSIFQIQAAERQLGESLFNIADGYSSYSVLSNGDCAGGLKTTVSHNRAADIRGEFELRLKTESILPPLLVKFSSYFNPLLQLQNGQAQILVGDLNISLESVGVNPLNISIDTRSAGQRWQHSLSLPGPVTLLKSGSRDSGYHYKLQSTLTGGANLSRFLEAVKPVLQKVSLEISPSDKCLTQNGAIDLSPVISLARKNPVIGELLNLQEGVRSHK